MVVDEPVVGDPPDLAPLDGTPLAQETELVRQRGHAHAQDECDVTDAQLLLGDRQEVDDPRSRWIRERREQVADKPSPVTPEGPPEKWTDGLRVEALDGAGVCVDLGGIHLSHRSSVPCTLEFALSAMVVVAGDADAVAWRGNRALWLAR